MPVGARAGSVTGIMYSACGLASRPARGDGRARPGPESPAPWGILARAIAVSAPVSAPWAGTGTGPGRRTDRARPDGPALAGGPHARRRGGAGRLARGGELLPARGRIDRLGGVSHDPAPSHDPGSPARPRLGPAGPDLGGALHRGGARGAGGWDAGGDVGAWGGGGAVRGAGIILLSPVVRLRRSPQRPDGAR